MKILVRLPNWLGDMVMASGFLDALQEVYPDAEVSVIAKKGLDSLLPYFPRLQHQFVFDKSKHKGLRGIWRFGRQIRQQQHFDIYFCLPDSFSSAFMGLASGAHKRVGYRKEGRSVLLTHAYRKPEGLHRVEEYIRLLTQYSGHSQHTVRVALEERVEKTDQVIVNINSEAQSRRLTIPKGIELITILRQTITQPIVLIGSPKEKAFIDAVYDGLPNREGIFNTAGQTNIPQMARQLAGARVMLSTDTGPAHLANALGTPTVVLFGAGNENNTAPYNESIRTVIRLGKLSCEPCLKNRCVCYEVPQCLERLDSKMISEKVKEWT